MPFVSIDDAYDEFCTSLSVVAHLIELIQTLSHFSVEISTSTSHDLLHIQQCWIIFFTIFTIFIGLHCMERGPVTIKRPVRLSVCPSVRQLSFLSGTDNVWYTFSLPLIFLPKLTYGAAQFVCDLPVVIRGI